MTCRECGAEMYLDDCAFNFTGNYDKYFVCRECDTGCILQVRFNKPFKELWHSEKGGNIKDYEIRR